MLTSIETRSVPPDITVVAISGRLSLGGSLAQLEVRLRRLIDGGCRRLVVDLASLRFIDSAAIGMLIGCNGQMKQNGGQMRIAGAGGTIAKIFDVVRLGLMVTLDSDAGAACRQLGAP